jgi:MarR family 2-MHQ and catechol resistance regulon transcriptional repressor
MTQKDIATKILRSSASVTSVVDKLERRGLVQRRRSEDDRRLVGVSLTEEGRSLMREVLPVYMGTVKQEFSVLTPAEQAYLGELCKKLGMAQQGPEGTIETEWMKGET